MKRGFAERKADESGGIYRAVFEQVSILALALPSRIHTDKDKREAESFCRTFVSSLLIVDPMIDDPQ